MQDVKPQIDVLFNNALTAMYRFCEYSKVPKATTIAKLKELIVKIEEMIKALEESKVA